jgi:Ca2+-transporting ATPase
MSAESPVTDIDLDRPWHTIDADDVVGALRSGRDGLSDDEVERRLESCGANRIRQGRGVSAWRVAIDQFASPLIYVLFGAGVATLLLQRWSDAIVIGAVLVVNGIVGFIQEYRAENAIQALMEMVAPKARVRRGGQIRRVGSDEVVPGDIVLVGEGDVVPADMRLIEATALRTDEAALTGESTPQTLRAGAMEEATPDLPPGDIDNIAYMGTAATSGSGEGVVVATGARTKVGQIAESIRTAGEQKAPLQRRMDRLAKWIAVMILGVAAVSMLVGVAAGQTLEQMFLLAVALAVAAMPAGLPVVMTVALAVGVRRMARRNAVIRHLPAVETLGSTTVIVSDKTGTLTRNRMAVREIVTHDATFAFEGGGAEAEMRRDGRPVDASEHAGLRETVRAGVLNSGAWLEETHEAPDEDDGDAVQGEGGVWLVGHGDPMDVAGLLAGRAAGMPRRALVDAHEKIDETPFETERRFSASVHEDEEGGDLLVCVKGAPEVVLEFCDRAMDGGGREVALDRDAIERATEDLASRGRRVLAFAIGRGEDARERVKSDEPRGFVFVGLQGLMDPPREEAADAVDACHEAGIRVVMVTGDHARTAASIAQQAHLDRGVRSGETALRRLRMEGDEAAPDAAPEAWRGGLHEDGLPSVRTGREMQRMSDSEFDESLRRVNVFARFQPQQKHRLVQRLKAGGNIVATTGDGVNDAPALKEADLGCAMGRTGTDVAKEASDMVITDDNLASVFAAVQEGRTAFRNIRMATFFLLSTGAADVLIILAALLAGWGLPLVPAQILWCNVVTNGIADVALGFEPGEQRLYRRPPRPPGEGVLNPLMIERLAIIGIWLAAGVLGVFYWVRFVREDSIELARTAALTTLVLFQKVHVFNCRSEDTSVFTKSLLRNRVLFIGVLTSLAVHVGAIYTPVTQDLLSLRPMDLTTWVVMSLVALTAIIPNELHKWLRARRGRRRV